ncbi:MAG: hypothetical protein ACTSU5_14630 [Promethearchaeota archaeon]
MDSIWARCFLEVGVFGEEFFYEYRYIYEVVIGIVGLYVFVDIRFHSEKTRRLWKEVVLGVGTNLITTLVLLILFVPAMRDSSAGFTFLFNAGIPRGVKAFIMLTKVIGIGGYSQFILRVAVLLVRSKLFSRWTTLFFVLGVFTMIDLQITIPVLDQLFSWDVSVTLIFWIVGLAFVVAARLNYMRLNMVTNIHELGIVHKSGATIFSYSDGKVDPDLVGSAMTGVISFLQEISGSEKQLRKIDVEDVKFLFVYGNKVFASLIADQDSAVLFKMLNNLLCKFEASYDPVLENWNGNVATFERAGEIVASVFSHVPAGTPGRGEGAAAS